MAEVQTLLKEALEVMVRDEHLEKAKLMCSE